MLPDNIREELVTIKHQKFLRSLGWIALGLVCSYRTLNDLFIFEKAKGAPLIDQYLKNPKDTDNQCLSVRSTFAFFFKMRILRKKTRNQKLTLREIYRLLYFRMKKKGRQLLYGK